MRDIVVIKGARRFDDATGCFDEAADLVIEHGVISTVGCSDEFSGGEVMTIEAEGEYLVPGLWECHAHLADLCHEHEEDGQLKALQGFSSRGILYVRDVGGPVERLERLAVLAEERGESGPRIFYAGPMLEKSPLTWAECNDPFPGYTVAVDSAAQISGLVQYLASHGVTHLKTFNKFDPEVYRALADEAREAGLPIVHDPGGPLFHDIPMDVAIGLGVRCFEHAKSPWSIVLKPALQATHDALKLESTAEQRKNFACDLLTMGIESISEEKLTVLARTMVDRDVYFCPTLNVFNMRLSKGEQVGEKLRYMRERLYELSLYFVGFMADRGVRILVGHDGFDPQYTFAEMDELAKAGLSPAGIIRGATSYPASWFGRSGSIGQLEPGYEASMLVLRENPLETIEHLKTARLVIDRGRIIQENGVRKPGA